MIKMSSSPIGVSTPSRSIQARPVTPGGLFSLDPILDPNSGNQIEQDGDRRIRRGPSLGHGGLDARMRVLVKRLLRKYGYPPDLQDAAVQKVLQQAEALSADWAA
jgi:Domain of unknown function (DUF3387)